MAIYQDQVSKRLTDFIEKHLTFEDNGDPENGPSLDSYYNVQNGRWIYTVVQLIGLNISSWYLIQTTFRNRINPYGYPPSICGRGTH